MFHREGYKLILITTIVIGISFIFIDKFATDDMLNRGLSIFILIVYLFILQQYRNSKRVVSKNETAFLAPVDGKVTSIENTENHFVLTFYSSVFNFHSIRAPFEGISHKEDNAVSIKSKHNDLLTTTIEIHSGKFGTESVVYDKKNKLIPQGEEIGFINFDGKVTMIVPRNSNLQVKINDRVKAGEHRIATI